MANGPDTARAVRAAAPPTAKAGGVDLVRLVSRLGLGKLGGDSFDPGRAVCAWARRVLARRDGAVGVRAGVGGRGVEIVADPDRSEAILGATPGDGYRAGDLKVGAMRFLAPEALTVADGERWRALRPFNEGALGTGGPHPHAQPFLGHVRAAFEAPVSDRAGVERAMARAMAGIVLGGDPTEAVRMADDVGALFDVVQSPVRRLLLGWRYRGRRQRLYEALARRWEAAAPDDPDVLGTARRHAPDLARRTLLEQVPHWMFTFTRSGTDLLTRTLAMTTTRSDVRRRVAEECAAAGAADRAETVERLAFTRACVLETGRLFPPVTRTFHHGVAEGGREVVHWFPLLQRSEALGASVHDFRPERWLADAPDAAAAASNLFLRGPRACPGSDLILFVCTAAVARQVGEIGITGRGSRLSRDPLPISFPEGEARFAAPKAAP
jgi:hypothetical protein